MDLCIKIAWSKYRDVCFKLAPFYNICLLYENVAIYYTYDVFDMSRVTSWLIGLDWINNNYYYYYYYNICTVAKLVI
jgi:hypothetical protein